MYFWAEEDSQKKTARKLALNKNLVNQIYRKLEDICSVDIHRRPFIPFGGPAHIIMCDESKFNHKAKVLDQFTERFCVSCDSQTQCFQFSTTQTEKSYMNIVSSNLHTLSIIYYQKGS